MRKWQTPQHGGWLSTTVIPRGQKEPEMTAAYTAPRDTRKHELKQDRMIAFYFENR